jgi:hypothetical protein
MDHSPACQLHWSKVIPWKQLALVLFFSACLQAQDIFQIHGYIQGRFTNQEGTPDRLEIRRARVIPFRDCLTHSKPTS